MAILKTTYKRWDGTAWQTHFFETSADLITETDSYKVLSSTERTKISDYLTTFNNANELLKLDGAAKIPTAQLPDLSSTYLTKADPTFTGTLGGPLWSNNNGDITIRRTNTTTAANTSAIDLKNGFIDLKVGTANIRYDGTDLDMNGLMITGLGAPSGDNDAVRKIYVDSLVGEGASPVSPVEAVADGSSYTLSGTQEVDGVALGVDDRVLVINRTTASENGIYLVKSGAWEKVTAESVKGTLVFIQEGDVYNDHKFYADSDTSWIVFSQVDTYTAGAGITKTGTEFSIGPSAITNAMLAGSINVSKLLDFASAEGVAYTAMTNATTADSLSGRVEDILSAIKNLRGTANYKTNNTETIAGAYTLANSKNVIEYGTADPSTSGYNEGDVFLQLVT